MHTGTHDIFVNCMTFHVIVVYAIMSHVSCQNVRCSLNFCMAYTSCKCCNVHNVKHERKFLQQLITESRVLLYRKHVSHSEKVETSCITQIMDIKDRTMPQRLKMPRK